MDTSAIILAAGQGTRMNHPELPKVLVPLGGRPLVRYVLDTLGSLGMNDPVIVLKYKADMVRKTLGAQRYVEQDERVGTGAAAFAAEPELGTVDGLIYIANGDNPFFSVATYASLRDALRDPSTVLALAMGRVEVGGSTERFGRILRSSDGSVERIVEYKDAADAERAVTECNAGLYLARSDWLWGALRRIEPSAVTGEYYITDLVGLAIADGQRVAGVPVHDDYEAHGVNTPQELNEAERLLKERLSSGQIAA